MRKAMTKTMTQALTIPTFTFSDDMDATSLLHLRKNAKAHIDGLTLLPFFIKALSLAMLEFPIVNSIVNPEKDSEGLIKEYIIKNNHYDNSITSGFSIYFFIAYANLATVAPSRIL